MAALVLRIAQQSLLFQIRCQGVRSRLPSPGPESQLWQGSTVPSGATAMLERQAPQLGIWVNLRARSVASGSQRW